MSASWSHSVPSYCLWFPVISVVPAEQLKEIHEQKHTISCSITWILNITTPCRSKISISSGQYRNNFWWAPFYQKKKKEQNRLEPKEKEKKLDGVSGKFRPGFEPGSSKRKIGLQANCLTTRTTMYPHDWASSKRRTTSPFIPFLTGGCLWKQPCNFGVPSLVPVLHSRTRTLASTHVCGAGGGGGVVSRQAYSTCTTYASKSLQRMNRDEINNCLSEGKLTRMGVQVSARIQGTEPRDSSGVTSSRERARRFSPCWWAWPYRNRY